MVRAGLSIGLCFTAACKSTKQRDLVTKHEAIVAETTKHWAKIATEAAANAAEPCKAEKHRALVSAAGEPKKTVGFITLHRLRGGQATATPEPLRFLDSETLPTRYLEDLEVARTYDYDASTDFENRILDAGKLPYLVVADLAGASFRFTLADAQKGSAVCAIEVDVNSKVTSSWVEKRPLGGVQHKYELEDTPGAALRKNVEAVTAVLDGTLGVKPPVGAWAQAEIAKIH